MKIGEYLIKDGNIVINEGKKAINITVKNAGERPVQVGSHFHFFETNKSLEFDREKAYGYRLDIPSGTAIRFEPHETKKVGLVEIGGKRRVLGANGLVNGFLDENKNEAVVRMNKFCKGDK